jgi:transposase
MSESAPKAVRRVYSTEFKGQAVRMVVEQKMTCDDVGVRLGVPAKTVANWARPLRQARRRQEVAVGVAGDDPAASRALVADLQKENARLRTEREILKKFGQYAASRMPGGLT